MKIKTFVALTIIFLLFSFSCKETPPEPSNGSIGNGMLIVEDVGVTDAVLRLRVPGGFRSQTVTLKRDTTTIFHSSLTTHMSLFDTLIIDESLLPKHRYRYTLTVENLFNMKERNYAEVTTMDTSSHGFKWEKFTLGNEISSILYDVAIINDTCVWAVGEIFVREPPDNPDYKIYNLAIWNGVKWQLLQVPYRMWGTSGLRVSRLKSIFVNNINDIYVASSASLLHWDGIKWSEKAFFMTGVPFDGQVTKIWMGNDEKNIYCGGLNGAMYLVNDTIWSKLETGTALDINDIFGNINETTGKIEVMAVAADAYTSTERKIFKIAGSEVIALPDSGIKNALSGIWFVPGKKCYVVGKDIFLKRINIDGKIWMKDMGSYYSRYYKNAIRANGLNDIIVASTKDVLHYNGSTWTSYIVETYLGYGVYRSIAIKGDIVIAVGDDYGLAVATIGRR